MYICETFQYQIFWKSVLELLYADVQTDGTILIGAGEVAVAPNKCGSWLSEIKLIPFWNSHV
jgi:hypothetical protein